MALAASHRTCTPTPEAIQRIYAQLALCGLRLPSHVVLPFGILVRMLDALALSCFLRLDDDTLHGAWWHGRHAPQVERRIAVRYRPQNPRRAWTSGVRGRPVIAARLPALLGGSLAPVIEDLQARGRCFHFDKLVYCRYTDRNGFLEGTRIKSRSLYCVVMGFELILRCSVAFPFDPAEDSGGSDSSS